MSSTLVARKDFEDVIRSWLLWAVLGVFVMMMVVTAIGMQTSDSPEEAGTEIVYDMFHTLGGEFLLPLTALMVGYMAIVGERQSGTLRVLFGLSHNRKDVFFGKLMSRVFTIAVASVLALVVAAGLILYTFDSYDLVRFLAFSGLTVLYAASFTSVAVAISAVTAARAKAIGGAVGAYVLFMIVWDTNAAIIYRIVNSEFPGLHAENWYFLLRRLNPMTAYREGLGLLIDQHIWTMVGATVVEDIPSEMLTGEHMYILNRVGEDLPFYLGEWASVAVLVGWIVVPLAISYWAFQRADLN